jgi:acetyltransferase-like isoleucine patch superfamily enzyme
VRLFWFLRLRIYALFINVVGWSGYLGPVTFCKGFSNIYFGRDCRIFPGARQNLFLTCSDENISIGSHCIFSANVFIGTQKNDFSKSRTEYSDNWFKENVSEHDVTIGNRCFIGFGAVILPGTVLGDGCVVGANAVVSGCHPINSTIAPLKSVVMSL